MTAKLANFAGARTDKQTSQLSGGQKQKLAVAGLLAFDANVLIFDEVASMMDIEARCTFDKIIATLKVENKSVVTITQNLSEAFEADTIAIFAEGKLLACQSPESPVRNSAFTSSGHLHCWNYRNSSS